MYYVGLTFYLNYRTAIIEMIFGRLKHGIKFLNQKLKLKHVRAVITFRVEVKPLCERPRNSGLPQVILWGVNATTKAASRKGLAVFFISKNSSKVKVRFIYLAEIRNYLR